MEQNTKANKQTTPWRGAVSAATQQTSEVRNIMKPCLEAPKLVKWYNTTESNCSHYFGAVVSLTHQ